MASKSPTPAEIKTIKDYFIVRPRHRSICFSTKSDPPFSSVQGSDSVETQNKVYNSTPTPAVSKAFPKLSTITMLNAATKSLLINFLRRKGRRGNNHNTKKELVERTLTCAMEEWNANGADFTWETFLGIGNEQEVVAGCGKSSLTQKGLDGIVKRRDRLPGAFDEDDCKVKTADKNAPKALNSPFLNPEASSPNCHQCQKPAEGVYRSVGVQTETINDDPIIVSSFHEHELEIPKTPNHDNTDHVTTRLAQLTCNMDDTGYLAEDGFILTPRKPRFGPSPKLLVPDSQPSFSEDASTAQSSDLKTHPLQDSQATYTTCLSQLKTSLTESENFYSFNSQLGTQTQTPTQIQEFHDAESPQLRFYESNFLDSEEAELENEGYEWEADVDVVSKTSQETFTPKAGGDAVGVLLKSCKGVFPGTYMTDSQVLDTMVGMAF